MTLVDVGAWGVQVLQHKGGSVGELYVLLPRLWPFCCMVGWAGVNQPSQASTEMLRELGSGQSHEGS
jgi:hypothetical protein